MTAISAPTVVLGTSRKSIVCCPCLGRKGLFDTCTLDTEPDGACCITWNGPSPKLSPSNTTNVMRMSGLAGGGKRVLSQAQSGRRQAERVQSAASPAA